MPWIFILKIPQYLLGKESLRRSGPRWKHFLARFFLPGLDVGSSFFPNIFLLNTAFVNLSVTK